MKKVLMALAVTVSLCAAPAAAQEQTAARTVVEDLGARIFDILTTPDVDPRDQQAQIACVLSASVDFKAMTRKILGRKARRMDPNRLDEFAQMISVYLAKLSHQQLVNMGVRGFAISGQKSLPNDDLLVAMRVEAGAPDKGLTLGFRMRQTNSGLKVVDLQVEQFSAAMHFSGEFDRRSRGEPGRAFEILKSEVGDPPTCLPAYAESGTAADLG
ncbi:MAG: ABC transporter substrate-binding protein [Alphaproteobacteria bacterium]|nr:ABC transporter substrate-binding protein [Alphaproteobacteria bacterium]